jgi:hypothetical protein
MSEAAKVITVDGVEYRHVAAPSEVRIVVLQRGWIVVGRWAQDGDEVVVRDASVVRFWGTTRGLGELFDGPTKTTKLDSAVEEPLGQTERSYTTGALRVPVGSSLGLRERPEGRSTTCVTQCARVCLRLRLRRRLRVVSNGSA